MRILLTGSSGQIGTNVAVRLLADGHEVLGIDKAPNPWTDEIDTEKVDLVALGRGSQQWSPPWQPDCIVHLAAWAKVHRLVVEPEKALENIEMAFAALEIARATGTPISTENVSNAA